ncbi:hypothetical protein PENSPDRAFT_750204 [Peniophora sp. CONT]|nr:hypothetical protein PENSPDRAFT_750204 [Peniophora sp. CONT]
MSCYKYARLMHALLLSFPQRFCSRLWCWSPFAAFYFLLHIISPYFNTVVLWFKSLNVLLLIQSKIRAFRLRATFDHRAWAFQRAFEGARELVRYSVLNTLRIWSSDWRFKGQQIPREHIQQAYMSAPEDLKLAVEWQLRWDTAAWMTADFGRRCHEHLRKEDAGIEQEILTPEQFQVDFDAASLSTQQSVLLTFPSWMEKNHGVQWPMPDRTNVKQAYETPTLPLKGAVCFVLEICYETLGFDSARTIAVVKRNYRKMVRSHQLEAREWDAKGQALGLW